MSTTQQPPEPGGTAPALGPAAELDSIHALMPVAALGGAARAPIAPSAPSVRRLPRAPRTFATPPLVSADVAGFLLLAACAGWVVYASSGREARPEDPLTALLAVTAGYAVGRIAGAVRTTAAPAAAGLLLAVPAALVPGSPGATAFSALAVALLCVAALRAERWALRRALFLAALLTAGQLALAGGLSAGTAAGTGTVLVCAAGVRAHRRLPGLLLLGGFAAAVAAGALLTARQGLVPAWHPAFTQLAAHPLRGLGPGGLTSPSAAPALLRSGAELGLPGLALLGAAYVWSQYALLLAPAPAPEALTASAALTLLAAEAATTTAPATPWIAAVTGLLLGIVTARPDPPPPGPRR
jgi:hypothetical protein